MKPGDLMRIIHAPDMTPWVRAKVGKTCILIRNLSPDDGVLSSPNIWEVLVDGGILHVHKLDLESVNETR
jgi:archaellum component FlaG (FlaF/FlaG flagellin family)